MSGRRELITEDDLIKKYRDNEILMHLARTPIVEKDRPAIALHKQFYAIGFNVGGRPEGFWFSQGTNWLAATRGFDNPAYPPCCYLYEVIPHKRAKILKIRNMADFKKFDAAIPSYWLNFDYYELDFTDYLTGESIVIKRKHNLDFSRMRHKPGEATKSVFINNNIIFTSAAQAKKQCEFYRTTKIPIERFKYKDWNEAVKKYDGIQFQIYDKKNKELMKYIWYQTLDVASGCIWNPTAVARVNLLYAKRDKLMWEKIGS